jgi:hypothetical protein
MDTQPNNKVSVAIFVCTLTVVVVAFTRAVIQYIFVAIIGNGHLKKMGKNLNEPMLLGDMYLMCKICL